VSLCARYTASTRVCVAAVLIFSVSVAAPAATAQAPRPRVVFRSGTWVVRRTIDPMTDAPDCRAEPATVRRVIRPATTPGGVPDTLDHVVLNTGPNGYVFFIAMDRPVTGYILRFGNETAQPMRLATDLEQHLSAVVLQGDDLTHLLTVSRLRAQVYSLESKASIVDEDIDLRGMAAAHEFAQTNARCRAP
jgi:hypothetical protein